jgi:hypothetical protein
MSVPSVAVRASIMTRELKFGVITFLIVLLVIELMSWGFAALATRFGILHFYRTDIFSRVPPDQLAQSLRSNGLGWPSHDETRPAPGGGGAICGSAFGDSFTFGGEVEEHEAWVHLLSLRAGCMVRNYAVSGYGLDQAVLRYERIVPEGNLVVLGLFTEMPRRSVAASWTFYASAEPPVYSNIKPYFTASGEDLRLHPIPQPVTRESIVAHHAHDYYMNHVWTAYRFPHTFQMLRALYRRVLRAAEYRLLTDSFWGEAHPSRSGILTRRLVDRLVRSARDRSKHVAIVLMQHVDRLQADTPHYDKFANELRGRGDVCVIDTKPILRTQASLVGRQALRAPNGHYTVLGNRVIAEAVAAGLDQCAIKLD